MGRIVTGIRNEAEIAEVVKINAKELCFAAGVLYYLRQLSDETKPPDAKGVEFQTIFIEALTDLTIGEAQFLYARAAAQKGTSVQLVAKLTSASSSLFRQAEEKLKQVKYINPALVDYISGMSYLAESVTMRFQGHYLWEAKKRGEAVLFLRVSVESLKKVSGKSSKLSPSLENTYRAIDRELKRASSVLQRYEYDNSKVYYNPVPSNVVPSMPPGKMLAKLFQYEPPKEIPIDVALSQGSCIIA